MRGGTRHRKRKRFIFDNYKKSGSSSSGPVDGSASSDEGITTEDGQILTTEDGKVIVVEP